MFRKPTSGLNRPCPLTSSTLSLTHTSQVPWYSDGVRPLNHRKPTRSRGLRTAKSSDPTKFSPANAKSRIKAIRFGTIKQLKILLAQGANPNSQFQQTRTALVQAAIEGKLGMIQTLVKHGANVNQADADKSTALHAAMAFSQRMG